MIAHDHSTFDTPDATMNLSTQLFVHMLAEPPLRWIETTDGQCPHCRQDLEACWTRPAGAADNSAAARFNLSVRCAGCAFRAGSQHSITRFVRS